MHSPAPARVLVIDDDPQLLRQMTTAFEAAGFNVRGAADGRLGAQMFDAEPADLVVTDIVMPQQGGIETIAALRQTSMSVRIIAISGGAHHGVRDDLGLALQVGADRVLQKPFRLSALVALGAQVLNHYDADAR